MNIIIVLLAMIAAYCFGMWFWQAYLAFTRNLLPSEADRLENDTFHLGLCGILALGFVGLLLK